MYYNQIQNQNIICTGIWSKCAPENKQFRTNLSLDSREMYIPWFLYRIFCHKVKFIKDNGEPKMSRIMCWKSRGWAMNRYSFQRNDSENLVHKWNIHVFSWNPFHIISQRKHCPFHNSRWKNNAHMDREDSNTTDRKDNLLSKQKDTLMSEFYLTRLEYPITVLPVFLKK